MSRLQNENQFGKRDKAILQRFLTNVPKLLVRIGKPFFKILSLIVLVGVIISYITGLFVRLFFTKPKQLRSKISKIVPLLQILAYRQLKSKIKALKAYLYEKSESKSIVIYSSRKRNRLNSLWEITAQADFLKPITAKSLKTAIRWAGMLLKILGKAILYGIKLSLFSFRNLSRFLAGIQPKSSIFYLFHKFRLRKIRLAGFISKHHLPKLNFLKLASFLAAFFFLFSAIGALAFWEYVMKDLPSPNELKRRNVTVSTKIYDRNGILLYNIFKDENRTPVSLDEIPVQLKLATIAIEDSEFYNHPGFSIKGITRALYGNLKGDRLEGGSTITQQLVKNTLLSPEKTLSRKLKEMVLAVQIELAFGKDEILEMYLNEVSYGGTAYGIQAASKTYFDKNPKDLTLAEAALLAGLPKSPTSYSPFGPTPEKAFSRQKEVLSQMYANTFITEEQMDSALNEQIVFTDKMTNIKAPHFVMYVREELEKKYGQDVVERGGLNVTTTLDLRIQEMAEQVVRQEVESLKNLHVTNAAVIVMNPKTGEILAMVGSKDYFDNSMDGNVNVAIRPRQPGSSIKIVNYAYALSHGYNPSTLVKDLPVTFLVENQPPYTPKNYEGGFRGNLTVRSALAESRNIPAVRILSSYGVNNMLDLGQKMGITTWQNPADYGLSLTLGGGEVKLVDLATVYATVADYGNKPEVTPLLEVTNYKNETLNKFACNQENSILAVASASESALNKNQTGDYCRPEEVLDKRVAFMLIDILKDNAARSPAFGLNSLLVIPDHPEVAVKTGTSNDLRDNLTVGFNQDYLVAVWVGNNDNSEMARIASGVTGATPIFNKIMSALLQNEESRNWEVPDGLVQVAICPYTGTLACDGCPRKLEWFLEENIPDKACRPAWFAKEDNNEEQYKHQDNNNTPSLRSENAIMDKKMEILDLRKKIKRLTR